MKRYLWVPREGLVELTYSAGKFEPNHLAPWTAFAPLEKTFESPIAALESARKEQVGYKSRLEEMVLDYQKNLEVIDSLIREAKGQS